MVGLAISFLGNLVRPARFERAAYGFEDKTSEFSNLLKLNQHIEIIKLKIPIFLLIFHVLAEFGKIFSHNYIWITLCVGNQNETLLALSQVF
jgi:hypothetical protein